MCYNIFMLRKWFLLFTLLTGSVLSGWTAQSTPLILEGSFSSSANTAADAQVFDQAARDREIAQLREWVQAEKYQDVLNRINALTVKNYLDDRFYLFSAIAHDGLQQYEDVVYSASQAIAVAPQDPRPYLLRATAYTRLGNYERAQMDLDTALKLNPTSFMGQTLQKELNEKQK